MTNVTNRWGLALGCAAALYLPAQAMAEQASVAVVAPAGTELNEGLRKNLEREIRDAVYAAAAEDADFLAVVGADAMGEDVANVRAACTDVDACRGDTLGAVATKNVDYVVDVWIAEPVPGDIQLSLNLVEVATGDEVDSDTFTCSACTATELQRRTRNMTVDAVDTLLRRLGKVEEEAAAVEAPAPVIEPEVGPAPPPIMVPRSKMAVPGWVLIGAGSAAVIGGAALMAVHGAEANCENHDSVPDECVPLVYDTILPGGVVTGVGAAAVITGAVLAIVAKRRDKAALENATLEAGAGYVGVRGRF